jgi:hypothetical protein
VARSSPCASPHSAPLRPPHPASPPASASGGGTGRNALRERLSRSRSVLTRASSTPRFRHRVRASRHDSSPPKTPAATRHGMRFGNVLHVGGACWLALPPPVAMASSVVLVTPGASAFVPHLCSLVVPAGTLDAAPSGGGRQLSFRLSPNKLVNLFGGGGGQTGFGQRLNVSAQWPAPIQQEHR